MQSLIRLFSVIFKHRSYMENDFCEERGPVGPEKLDCLMLLVRTTIERMFPINPKIEIVVKRIPSMIKVARSFCSSFILKITKLEIVDKLQILSRYC